MSRAKAITLAKLAVLLAVLAAWVLIPHPLEGPVMASISTTHGIHLADLCGVCLASVIAVILV